MYKLHHLLTFQTVHRTGSFATAARELGYTTSAVSQQIAALEKETGLTLFEREAHGIRATTVAHRLAELSRGMLADVDEFDYQVRRLATGLSGRLRVGSFTTASVRLVPAALSDLRRRRPGVEITLDDGEPDTLLDSLVDGDLDVALVYEYGLSPRQWPPGVRTLALVREDLLLLRPSGETGPSNLSRLADRLWITSREGTAGDLSLARLCAFAGFTPAIAFRSNDYDVVRELVAHMGGVAVVPALGHVPDERISAVPLRTYTAAHRTVLAIHREGNANPVLGDFLTALRQAVPQDADHLLAL
ncbi:LysR family transcriptional regulator [Streptosporangium sp. NPDC001559]|uniref:LysR family transcriptional regulator n=1 Tax=Streptosporangium sp. NPDC001559 TaxID=3366187 RepID=UPI0036EFCBE3